MKYNKIHLIFLFLMLVNLTHCKTENSDRLKETYTLGIWTVKPGLEKKFISEWTSFANWTTENIKGSGKAYLLQDEKNSSKFISFGPWDNDSSIHKWRERNDFKDFVTKVKGLCDDFQPITLNKVSSTR